MNTMIIAFWAATILLFLFACGFVLPRLKSMSMSFAVVVLLAISSYGLYYCWGSSQYLSQYYSKDQQSYRDKLPELQNLFAEFKKEEYRLRCRLEENPNDLDAEWRLLDILAIKALNNGDKALAKEYWKKVLEKIPDEYSNLKADIKNRMGSSLDIRH